MAGPEVLTPTTRIHSPTQRKHTMNLKSILGLKGSPAVSAEGQAIADRVSTAAGCQALFEELTQQRQAEPNISPRAGLLRRQLAELARIQNGHAIAEDRQRAAAAVKRDMGGAAKSLKDAEARLKSANDAAGRAGTALAERASLVDRLNQELTELHAVADKAVDIARSGFNDAVTAQDQTGETTAADELRKAQQNRASCGESLTTRIKAHEAERQRLARESATATGEARQAQDDVNLARLQLARVEYDQAAQLMIDAFVKVRSLRAADSSGRAFGQSTIHNLDLTIASPELVAWGDRLVGESGRVRDWVLGDMAKTLAPADLALLTTGLPATKQPEEPLDLPNPFLHLHGSIDHSQAMAGLKRATAGMSEAEFEGVCNRLRVQASQSIPGRSLEPLAQ